MFVCFLKGCVLSKSLPHELKIVKILSAGNPRYGVFCGQLRIKKGMRFGPYTGSIVCPEEMATGSVQREFLWEVKYLRLLAITAEQLPVGFTKGIELEAICCIPVDILCSFI